MVMYIQNLFAIIAKQQETSRSKKMLYSVVSDILNLRKELCIKNDVYSIYEYKEDIIENLAYKYPNIRVLIQSIFDIPKVKAYIDVKREIQNDDDEDMSHDSDVYECDSEEESSDDDEDTDDDDESSSEDEDMSDDHDEDEDTSDTSSDVSMHDCVMIKRPFLTFLFMTTLINTTLTAAIAVKLYKTY